MHLEAIKGRSLHRAKSPSLCTDPDRRVQVKFSQPKRSVSWFASRYALPLGMLLTNLLAAMTKRRWRGYFALGFLKE